MNAKFPQNTTNLKQNENSANKELSQSDLNTRVLQNHEEAMLIQKELKTFSKLVEHFDRYFE